jgi:hypothetical protein
MSPRTAGAPPAPDGRPRPAHSGASPVYGLLSIRRPYALFLGDVHDARMAKTASGICFWRPGDCIAQVRLPG